MVLLSSGQILLTTYEDQLATPEMDQKGPYLPLICHLSNFKQQVVLFIIDRLSGLIRDKRAK